MRRAASSGILALFAIGVYVAIRNRDQIMSFLDRQGIRLPDAGRLATRVREGVNEVVDQVSSQVKADKDESLKRVS